MVFCPSIGGISHAKEEDTPEADLAAGDRGVRAAGEPGARQARLSGQRLRAAVPPSPHGRGGAPRPGGSTVRRPTRRRRGRGAFAIAVRRRARGGPGEAEPKLQARTSSRLALADRRAPDRHQPEVVAQARDRPGSRRARRRGRRRRGRASATRRRGTRARSDRRPGRRPPPAAPAAADALPARRAPWSCSGPSAGRRSARSHSLAARATSSASQSRQARRADRRGRRPGACAPAANSGGWSVTATSPTVVPATSTATRVRAAADPRPAPATAIPAPSQVLQRVERAHRSVVERVVVREPDRAAPRSPRSDRDGLAADRGRRTASRGPGRSAPRGRRCSTRGCRPRDRRNAQTLADLRAQSSSASDLGEPPRDGAPEHHVAKQADRRTHRIEGER